MISERAEFRDLDGERLGNLARLVRPGRAGPAGLIVLRRGGRVVKVRHTRRGRLEPGLASGAGGLAEAAAQTGARWAVAADLEALEAAAEAASARLRVGHGLLDFALEVARALADELRAGRIEIHPQALTEGLTLPSRQALDRFADAVLPPRSSTLLYVFDGSALHAELICVRGSREIELLAGHDALGCGPPPASWREHYRQLLEAATNALAPPSLGVFVSRGAARAILSPERPGELARALARRDLVIDPLPPWLAGPLGAAAVKGAVEAGRKASERLVERVRPTGLAGLLASHVKDQLGDRLRKALSPSLEQLGQLTSSLRGKADQTVNETLNDLLGFDALALFSRLAALLRPDDDPGRS